MEFALTEVFGSKQRDMLRQRLMGLVMMVIFLAATLASAIANGAAAVSVIGGIVGPIIAGIVLIVLLMAIYRFVPNRTFGLKDIWPGAVLAGVLIEIFSLIFPLYAKVAHGFNTYGQQFALFFLLATWLTFLCQFILLGAVFIRLRVGDPACEGIVPAPDSESGRTKRIVDAIHEERRGSTEGAHSLFLTPKEKQQLIGGAVSVALGAVGLISHVAFHRLRRRSARAT